MTCIEGMITTIRNYIDALENSMKYCKMHSSKYFSHAKGNGSLLLKAALINTSSRTSLRTINNLKMWLMTGRKILILLPLRKIYSEKCATYQHFSYFHASKWVGDKDFCVITSLRKVTEFVDKSHFIIKTTHNLNLFLPLEKGEHYNWLHYKMLQCRIHRILLSTVTYHRGQLGLKFCTILHNLVLSSYVTAPANFTFYLQMDRLNTSA